MGETGGARVRMYRRMPDGGVRNWQSKTYRCINTQPAPAFIELGLEVSP